MGLLDGPHQGHFTPANAVAKGESSPIYQRLSRPRNRQWSIHQHDDAPLRYAAARTRHWRSWFRWNMNQSLFDEPWYIYVRLLTPKYRAWEHQLAMNQLASWFIAETWLDWMKRYERDPALLAHYKVKAFPLLSVSNVRELQCSCLSYRRLKQLTWLSNT